ncbi:hypothetical protein SAMN05428945_4898 [Streptomyces sp. 2224.1]|nr:MULTISPECIES: hypothetical protein [unclassified Streptomyces]PBC80600.1 hypothetical protein BX261_0437 [Streptomyces sp. 2321.6]SDR57954.1 hypothetical protein SAMN05216511_6784 [Streptomyces sp. KS_16]SEB81154.1 hypothetical protein SAMN05428940_0437 [Streptomyces sp. 2133.1]SED43973.1 hypothetical protein SAMN05428945_4898 [Streptomyces sp. 2224.1]SEF13816.1 hypothetical protein SAMN05428954_6837 [Streptomyces sp. 2112.3]
MNDNQTFHPGEIVPAGGLYEDDGDQAPHRSTDVKGHSRADA